MEFLLQNYINTTTQITVTNNTGVASNIFNRDKYAQFYTDGDNFDTTTTTFTFTFDATTSVSRIAILDHNLREYTIFYNGATANTFSFSGGATASSSFSSNSETSQYFRCTTALVSSVTINMKKTMTANQEKLVGLFIISDTLLVMDQIPDSGGYDPKWVTKETVHVLADGGMRVQKISNKWSANLTLDYVNQTLRNNLKDVYDLRTPFIFCPFGTSTSFDGNIFEAIWVGDFDFYEYSDNAVSAGFSGSIRLRETPI